MSQEVQTCECGHGADLNLPRRDLILADSADNCISRFAIRPIALASRPNTVLSCAVTSLSVLSSVVGCPLTIANTTAMQRVTEYPQLTKFISYSLRSRYWQVVFLFLWCDTQRNNVTLFAGRQGSVTHDRGQIGFNRPTETAKQDASRPLGAGPTTYYQSRTDAYGQSLSHVEDRVRWFGRCGNTLYAASDILRIK